MSMTDGLSEAEKLLYSIFGRFLPRKGVCYLCFESHEDKLLEIWKNANANERKDFISKYRSFKLDYEKDKISTVIDIGSGLPFYVCKKHLLDMVESIDEFEREQNGKTS
jgi:hypothetical protein